MTVCDNGVGLAAGFDITTTKSLGLRLVNFLTKHQLKGRIELKTFAGTEITLHFSEPKVKKVAS